MKSPKHNIVIIIDGPEKSGKTTFLKHLQMVFLEQGYEALMHKWSGRADPDESIYLNALKTELSFKPPAIWLWDRGWPSEYVYGTLLGQDRPMTKSVKGPIWENSFAEWSVLKIIMLSPSVEHSVNLLDDQDIKINPCRERILFSDYANSNGWHLVLNTWDYAWLEDALLKVYRWAILHLPLDIPGPYEWAHEYNSTDV